MVTGIKRHFEPYRWVPGLNNTVKSLVFLLFIQLIMAMLLALEASVAATEMTLSWRIAYVSITFITGLLFFFFLIFGFLANTHSGIIFFSIPFGLLFAVAISIGISYVLFNDFIKIQDSITLGNYFSKPSFSLIQSIKFRFLLLSGGRDDKAIILGFIILFSLVMVAVPFILSLLFRFSKKYKILNNCQSIQFKVYERCNEK